MKVLTYTSYKTFELNTKTYGSIFLNNRKIKLAALQKKSRTRLKSMTSDLPYKKTMKLLPTIIFLLRLVYLATV